MNASTDRLPGPSRTLRSRRPAPVTAGTVSLLFAATVAVSSACTDGRSEGPPAAPVGREAPATLDPGEPASVRLTDPGRGVRRVLAYRASAEPTATTVTLVGTRRTSLPNRPPTTDDTPEQSTTLRGAVDPDVDGAVRVSTTVDDATSVDERRAAQFATAHDFGVTWVRGAGGQVHQVSLEAPTGATDAARAGVEVTTTAVTDHAVVWPSEPVGVGASWEASRAVPDGVAPTRVVTYRLDGLDGDVARVSTSTRAPVASHTLAAPDGPEGGGGPALRVERYEVTGTGQLTVALSEALPRSGTVTDTTKAAYRDPGTGAETTFDERRSVTFTRR